MRELPSLRVRRGALCARRLAALCMSTSITIFAMGNRGAYPVDFVEAVHVQLADEARELRMSNKIRLSDDFHYKILD